MDGSESRGQQHVVTFAPISRGSGAGLLGSPGAVPFSQRKTPTGRGGTRRLGVDDQGHYTYKKTPSSTLTASLQIGLQHAIGSITPKPHRDILMTDFEVVDTVEFPAAGSDITPAHKYKDFTFKTYSPEAMRFFREAFGILPEDFLLALCVHPLREVGNPGASGSLFFLSADDAFILKTVQKKEARFLQKLLPGYYLNLTQNKRTLLPKFFGLYRYKSGSINIRIVIMNNLLPSGIRYHEKYDLKGSTFKRKANPREIQKSSPTFKDLDFMERHDEGIILAPEKYEALVHSVDRDCKVLESFGIMDYSLLLGVHNIDQAIREKAEVAECINVSEDIPDTPMPSRIELSKNFSIVSTEDIPSLLAEEQQQRHHYPEGYIQGRIHGDRVMFYLGIIDILQSYRLRKKLEHGFKSVIADAATVSVHNPSFYARRFQDFLIKQIFRKDKTKIRTRKNSTIVQLRGRRQLPSIIRPSAGSSGRESKTSPSHEPPTYNQAMKGSGVTPKLSNTPRQRSMSESVSASSRPSKLPSLSPTTSLNPKGNPSSPESLGSPTLVLYRSTTQSSPLKVHSSIQDTPKQDSTKDVPGRDSTKYVPGRDSTKDVPGRDSTKDVPGRDSTKDVPGRNSTKDVPGRKSAKDVPGQVQEPSVMVDHSVEETVELAGGVQDDDNDFGRSVRGTSTPIDMSPLSLPKQSRTFNDTNENSELDPRDPVGEVSVEIDVGSLDGIDEGSKVLARSGAIELPNGDELR